MPFNSMGYWFDGTEKWTVVSDTKIAWRDSPSYEDKAGYDAVDTGTKLRGTIERGDGPGEGDEGHWSGGLEFWFLKSQPVPGQFAFLPLNSSSLRPMLRPTSTIPSWSEERKWKIVYPGGAGARKSTFYMDTDIGDDGGPAVVFDEGTEFKGFAMPGTGDNDPDSVAGEQDLPEMIKVSDRMAPNGKVYTLYIPMYTLDGDQVCEAIPMEEGGPPPPAPPPFVPGAPPAPPPPPGPAWTRLMAADGRPYWHNRTSGAVTWSDPYAPPPPAPPPAPPPEPEAPPPPEKPEWEQLDADGTPYWHNNHTGQTTWDDPFAPPPPPPEPKPPSGKRRMPPPPEDEESEEYSSDEDEDDECEGVWIGDDDWEEDLTKAQRKAARKLGWDEETWNDGDLLDWEGTEWDDLSRNEKKACAVLGWDADFFEEEFEEDDMCAGSKSGRKASKYKGHKSASVYGKHRAPKKRHGGYKTAQPGKYDRYRR